MSDTYEKDVTERTPDRNLILLGCRADADIDYRDKKLGLRDKRIIELENALKPLAQFACSEIGLCDCSNCKARDLLAKGEDNEKPKRTNTKSTTKGK